jgi:MoxR-like ATPase/Mg-chelatase subunit ChlD
MRRQKGDYLRHLPAVAAQIIGRTYEIETILATLAAGKHIILEGPPGTTKSTILRAITQAVGSPLYYVAGSPDLTPAKLIGHFNPAQVTKDTYHPDHFTEGPLIHAMRGGFLFLDEFNRVPPDTANVLVTAIAEGELNIPRYGTVNAGPGFRVVCAHNPIDDVGTVRISRALYDRFCCIRMDHQNLEEELEVLRHTMGCADETINLVAVHLIRATRCHKDIKQGASIRGAIDMVTLFHTLGRLDELSYFERMREAMLTALSGKIWLSDLCTSTPEKVLCELLDQVLRSLDSKDPEEKRASGSTFQHDEMKGTEDIFSDDAEVEDDELTSVSSSQQQEMESSVDENPIATELKKRVGRYPEEVSRFLNQNPDIAGRILTSPDVLAMYSYIRRRVDDNLREAAKRYASRLIIKIAKEIANLGAKSGNLHAVADHLASDEIEIDLTLERIVEQPTESIEDNLVVLTRKPEEREACVVMLDHSSSMQGIKVAIAALTAATIALHFKDNYAVVGFNTQAILLKRIAQNVSPSRVAEEVLSLDARGLTNIREALELAFGEIRSYEKKIGILLTDGNWTYGGDPRAVARLFDRLHVIGLEDPPTPYELEHTGYGQYYTPFKDIKGLAKEGRGMWAYVRTLDEVPLALKRCLTS